MPEVELCLLVVRPLNQLGVRYFVSGSVASIIYGEPPLTHGVDFVVFLKSEEIPRLHHAFPAAAFYVPPTKIIAQEVGRDRKGHLNLIHLETGFKADFYASGRDPFHDWAV